MSGAGSVSSEMSGPASGTYTGSDEYSDDSGASSDDDDQYTGAAGWGGAAVNGFAPEEPVDDLDQWTALELQEIQAAKDASQKMGLDPPHDYRPWLGGAAAKRPTSKRRVVLRGFQFPKKDGIEELTAVPLCVVSNRWSRAELRSMDARPVPGRPELGNVRSLPVLRRYGHGEAQREQCACAWSPDGATIAYAQVGGVSLWDVRTGRPAREALIRSSLYPPPKGEGRDCSRSCITLLSFSCDGSLLACLPRRNLLVWDLDSKAPEPSGLELRVPRLPPKLNPFFENKWRDIFSAEFSPANPDTLAVSHSFGVSIYSIVRGSSEGCLGSAQSLHVPNASYEAALMAMEESTQEDSERGAFECFLPGEQRWAAWAPDGLSLAVGCKAKRGQTGWFFPQVSDLSVCVIDARSGALISRVDFEGLNVWRNAVAWSPSGDKIAIYKHRLKDHPAAATSAANTPFGIIEVFEAWSGQLLASLSAPKERLLPETHTSFHSYTPWDNRNVAWAPDDSAIVASVHRGLLLFDPKEPAQAGEFQRLPQSSVYEGGIQMLAFANAWQQPTPMRLALAMALHARLGKKSGLGRLGIDVLKLVASMCYVMPRRPWSDASLWAGKGKVRWQQEQRKRAKTELEEVLEKDTALSPRLAMAVRVDCGKPFCRVKEQTRISLHIEKHQLATGEGLSKRTLCALLGKIVSSNTSGWRSYRKQGLIKVDPDNKGLNITGDKFAAMRRHLKISRCEDVSCAYCEDYFGTFVEAGGQLTQKWSKRALQQAAEVCEGGSACGLCLLAIEGGDGQLKKIPKKTLKLADAFAKRHGKATVIGRATTAGLDSQQGKWDSTPGWPSGWPGVKT